MIQTKHYINDTEIRPLNADTIGFVVDYTADYNLPELNTDSIVLVNEARQIVLDHIANLGVFEGIPYTVEVLGISLDYFIDLTENPRISDSQIEVKIKRRKSVETFTEKARGLSFEAINTTHPFTTGLAKYGIFQDQQGLQIIMLSMNVFALSKELYDSTMVIAEDIAELTKASNVEPILTAIPVPPAIIPVPLPTVDLVKPLDVAFIILKIALHVAYTVFILLQIILLIKKIIDILIPPVKTFKVTQVKHLIERGCEKLGFDFESDFLDANSGMTILPVPLLNPVPSVFELFNPFDNTVYTKGYPSALDTTPTLLSLIEAVKSMCNGDLRVNGNTVRLDPNINDAPSTQISNTLNLQSKREDEYTFNTGDSWKRYYLSYRTDVSDIHTLNNFQDANTEYSTEPITVVNEDLVSIKGLVNIELPFALGARKKELNFMESQLLILAQAADVFINFFGGNGNNAARVNARVGILQISQQQFTTTKILYLNGQKQPTNYLDKIGADALYINHKSNQVKENFKRIFTSTIPLSDSKFNEIINGGNFVDDENTGEELEILRFEWINESREAVIEYGVKSDEANNTKTIKIF